MADYDHERRNLLSSQARIQVPWVKVTIGTYTFGVFSKTAKEIVKTNTNFYSAYSVKYPEFIESLQIVKINGQVNTYTLNIKYPVTAVDDPNFFEKVFSSVSGTRKIVFSYGDASMPEYAYKNEEAIITSVNEAFNFGDGGTISSVIGYTVTAVSACALAGAGSYCFTNSGLKKPSSEIKRMILNEGYGLKKLFPGVTSANINELIAGDDKAVQLETKFNISALDYVNYLVGCMVPENSTKGTTSSDIYILTIHDDTTYDDAFYNGGTSNKPTSGPYLRVSRTSYAVDRSDAYNVDIGINTSTIVTNFSIKNNETYSLYFDYQEKLDSRAYSLRLGDSGLYEYVYSPGITSNNDKRITRSEDTVWWTKLTKYPISAELTIQGLLRPAELMQYVRLNVIFPGGNRHISSGLYVVTKQIDTINEAGYRTQLSLTRLET